MFYWVYDLPTWLFCVVTVATFIAVSLFLLFPTRRWVRRQHRADHSHNEIVGFYVAAVTVFYGIALGLLAIGTWTIYSDAGTKISREAEVLSSMLRDVRAYPDPVRPVLRSDILDYAHEVVEVSWPLQQRGIVPVGSSGYLNRIQDHLNSYAPQTMGDQVRYAELYKKFNELIEARRARLSAIRDGMPDALWALVVLGAFITILVTLFFDLASFPMHVWMTTCLATLLGLMTFLVGTLDNPFRGQSSIKPTAIQLVYDADNPVLNGIKAASPAPQPSAQ